MIRHYISQKKYCRDMTLAPSRNRISIDVISTYISTILAVNSKTLRIFVGNKDRMSFLRGVHEIFEKMKSYQIQQSNYHLGIRRVRFCYHQDPRKNHVSAPEAWSISNCEGSCHVHFRRDLYFKSPSRKSRL